MKAKQSLYNLIFGLISQLIIIAFGIIISRLFLVKFGSEVNGLLSSISQVFVYMTLLEAGVGAASIQALYKPISKNEKDNINSILSATSRYYNKTGVYYFFIIIIISIVYPFVINSNLSKITVMIIILLSGMGGVINYFFLGKYSLLLSADGKGYINISVATIISILNNSAKITLLLLGYNIVVIQVSYLITTILQSIIIQFYIRKRYKWIDLSVKPNFDAISQKNSVLVHQIAYLIFANTDVLILTIFCNLKVVSVYVMYNLVFNMIDSVIGTVNGSIIFALGQSYHESKEKFRKFYDSYELYYMCIVFSLFVVAYILILPFMRLYTAGITDISYIDFLLPVLFVSYKILSCARIPGVNAINIAGHFKKTQNRAIAESVINIIFSLLFVNLFGIYGVLMGTIAALLYRSVDIIIYANKRILDRSSWITFKRWLIDATIFLIIVLIANIIKINPASYIDIFITGAILTIIIMPAYFIVGSLFDKDVYKFTISYFMMCLDKFLARK